MGGRFGGNSQVWENRDHVVSTVFFFAVELAKDAPKLPVGFECSFFGSPDGKSSSGCLSADTPLSVGNLRSRLGSFDPLTWKNALLTVRFSGDGPLFMS